MGGTRWSDAHYRSRAAHLRARGRSAFGYDEDIRAGSVAAGVHKKMDPAALKGGRRESRASARALTDVYLETLREIGEWEAAPPQSPP